MTGSISGAGTASGGVSVGIGGSGGQVVIQVRV